MLINVRLFIAFVDAINSKLLMLVIRDRTLVKIPCLQIWFQPYKEWSSDFIH